MPTIEYRAHPGSLIDLALRKYSDAQFVQFMRMVEGDGAAPPNRVTVSGDILLKKAWDYFVNDAGGDLRKMPISNRAQGNVTAWIMVNDFLVPAMMCVECNFIKPRFNEFFILTKSADMEQWVKYPPGLEPFDNSEKHPCRLCFAARVQLSARETPLGYFNSIASQYSFSAQDLLKMYQSLERGVVSDIPAKFLFAQTDHPLKVGVHELVRENWNNNRKKHDRKDHKLENCTVDLAFLNVPQRDRIPDLIAAVTQTYAATINHFSFPASIVNQLQADRLEFFNMWWNMTPADLDILPLRLSSQYEYDKQLHKLHLRSIIGSMCSKHKYLDNSKNRELMEEDVQCTPESYFQILCDNFGQCSICYSYLTVGDNLPTDLSYDRISNSHAHGDMNIQPVCSVHQAPNGLLFTEAMQLHACCIQTRVHVSIDARAKIIARHDALVTDGIACPFCDVERLE